jgi:hypothetical protein
MSCKVNTFGQPACFITAHPDHPQDKFCVTCRQRFYQDSHPYTYYQPVQSNGNGVFFLIIVVLMLVILFRIIPERSSNTTPSRQPARLENLDLVSHES